MPILSVRAALILGLLSMPSATPAFAVPDGQSAIVRFGDLDLGTPVGERALRRRVSHAAKLVCGDADLRDLQAMREIAACRAMAMASAAPQLQLAIAKAHASQAYAAPRLKAMSAPS